MYSETEKYKPKSQILAVLMVLGYVLGVILLGWACNLLRIALHLPLLEFVPYIAAAALVWVIYRTQIVEYCYNVEYHSLRIEKVYGRRRSDVAKINLHTAADYAPYRKDQAPKKVKMCALPASKNKMLLTFPIKDGETGAVVLSPSKRLDALLREKMAEDPSQESDDTAGLPASSDE